MGEVEVGWGEDISLSRDMLLKEWVTQGSLTVKSPVNPHVNSKQANL